MKIKMETNKSIFIPTRLEAKADTQSVRLERQGVPTVDTFFFQ